MRLEFADRNAAATVDTMSDENYVNHVPVMTGGRGREQTLEFYGKHFIPKMPADRAITPVCRTVSVRNERVDPTLPSNALIQRAAAARE